MKDDWIPLNCPGNLEEMLDAFVSNREQKVGWCLLCNSPIHTEADFISTSSARHSRVNASTTTRLNNELAKSRLNRGCLHGRFQP
jgi:hypothetical protein